MVGQTQEGEVGPDLAQGVSIADLEEGTPYGGHVGGEPVLLVRRGDEIVALGATCTHYGAPLADGLVVGDTIRCPWHHACFSLKTGEAVGAPALDPVDRWRVELRDGRAYVTTRTEATPSLPRYGRRTGGPDPVVIIGSGAAGSAAAEMLRREGFDGGIALVDPDPDAPYDRPNLSKDYLAGDAPAEWIPLRPEGFYAEHGIDRIEARAAEIDPTAGSVRLADGRPLKFGALLLATGATPVRLEIPGADLPHVHLLRSFADCRALIDASDRSQRAVILGASFIGMEAAASLRNRGLEVAVVAPERVPFERVFGAEIGRLLQNTHEEHGVGFRLGRTAVKIGRDNVRLDDGSELPADLVLIGVGVRPDTRLAEAAGLRVNGGILVDEYLRTSAPNVFAAGDIARYPDPITREPIRVEHWVLAQRQGQAAARNILGRNRPFLDAPFFWTRQWGVGIRYVGHVEEWDEIQIDGALARLDAEVRFLREGRTRAVATVGRDLTSLRAEAELESAARAAFAAAGPEGR